MTALIAFDAIMYLGLILLGLGTFWKKRECHLFRAGGWFLFGLYWFIFVPRQIALGDAVNTLGSALSLPIFSFIGYHEYLSYKWNEEYQPLKFVSLATFLGSISYFLIDRVPAIAGAIIYIVTSQTCWLYNLFGGNISYSHIDYENNPLWYRIYDNDVTGVINGSSVNIILACTAIQAILIAMSFILCARGDEKRKWKLIYLIVPSIYLLNLVRNVLVIHLVDVQHWDFELVHNYVGKLGISFVSMVVLMVIAFLVIPEFFEDFNGLFELLWRRKPRHDYMKHIGRLFNYLEKGKRGGGGGERKRLEK